MSLGVIKPGAEPWARSRYWPRSSAVVFIIRLSRSAPGLFPQKGAGGGGLIDYVADTTLQRTLDADISTCSDRGGHARGRYPPGAGPAGHAALKRYRADNGGAAGQVFDLCTAAVAVESGYGGYWAILSLEARAPCFAIGGLRQNGHIPDAKSAIAAPTATHMLPDFNGLTLTGTACPGTGTGFDMALVCLCQWGWRPAALALVFGWLAFRSRVTGRVSCRSLPKP